MEQLNEDTGRPSEPPPGVNSDDSRQDRRPGRPGPAPDAYSFIAKARPTPRGRITQALTMDCGRAWDLNPGQFTLLLRLAALLNPEDCKAGRFQVRAINNTLAHELNCSVRSIQLRLRHLEKRAALIYRHFTGGDVGLDRAAIDLAPLVARLEEVYDAIMDRAADRQDYRDQLNSTLAERVPEASNSPPHESDCTHNTQTPQYRLSTAIQEDEARSYTPSASGKIAEAQRGTPQRYQPAGFTPPPSSTRSFLSLIEQAAPDLAANGEAGVFELAYLLAQGWGLPQKVWGRGCNTHGRLVVAAVIAVAASRAADSFRKGRVAWICGCLGLPADKLNIWASLRAAAKRRTN